MRKSLNKSTVIIILALFLSLSVGYALFSETITIEGTATAKGDFDIVYACEVITRDNASEAMLEDGAYSSEGTVGNCVIDDGTIKATGTLNKSGDRIFFRILATNGNTFPIKLKSMDCINSDGICFDRSNEYGVVAAFYGLSNSDELITEKNNMINTQITSDGSFEGLLFFVWDDSADAVPPEEGTVQNYNVTLNFEQDTQ